MIKKFAAALLVLATLFICACGVPDEPGVPDSLSDENIASLFLNAIRNGEFIEAYSFLSSKFKTETDAEGSKNPSYISLVDFEQRFTTVFDLLGVNDIAFEIKEEKNDGQKKTVLYTLTYDTQFADKLTFDYEMSAVAEGDTWRVVWSPTLILPDLGEGDAVVRAKLEARRGDITAQGKSIASTVDLVSVYAVPSELIGRDRIIDYITKHENIDKSAAESRSYEYLQKYATFYPIAPEIFDTLATQLCEILEFDIATPQPTPSPTPDFSSGPTETPAGMPTNMLGTETDWLQTITSTPTPTPTPTPSPTPTIEPTPEKSHEELELESAYRAFGTAYNDFMLVAQYYPGELSNETIAALRAINGVHIDNSHYGTARYYPYGSLLAHTLGYVGYAEQDEVEKYNEGRSPSDGLYSTDSIVGKNGLEQLYETELRGVDGYYFFIRSSDGTNKKTIYRKEKQDGLDINLTIDLDLQLRTEELLELTMFGDDTAGAVVVMNPKTGAVEALASYPSFDLNDFGSGRISSEKYNALLQQKNTPLYNRTIQGLYPPGSTFKAFTAAAALDLGVMSEDYIFTGNIVNDYWTPTGYGAWQWPAIKRTRVTHRTSPMNMTNSMLHSDNIYFANAALKTGAEKFINYLDAFGMDSAIPFELNVRSAQLLNRGSTMNYKLLADSGYGQGEVLVTPLQLTAMFAAFRNDGDVPVPYITDSYYKTDGINYDCVYKNEPETWLENAVSEASISKIVPMLEGVVDPTKNGTGRSLRVPNCDVAGKTGSAEIGSDKSRIISWFAGFRLNVDEDDERVVIIMLEIPDHSPYTTIKFQIARELLKFDETPDPNLPPDSPAVSETPQVNG